MKKVGLYIVFCILFVRCDSPFFSSKEGFVTHFEKSNGNESTSYDDLLSFYKELSSEYTSISLRTMGETDTGKPLHLVIFNPEGRFDFNRIGKEKAILLIANGLQVGQSEGIDATMLLMRNLAQKQIRLPENLVIVAIPTLMPQQVKELDTLQLYSTDEGKNKLLYSDFIKNEYKTTEVFSEIFHLVQPDIFIDTRSVPQHNDRNTIFYQTIIPEKMGHLQGYLQSVFVPRIADSLSIHSKELQADSIPTYSQLFLPYPDTAFPYRTPSSIIGYASLWNTLSLNIASQYEKPYKERVEGMYNALKTIISVCDTDVATIKRLRKSQSEALQKESEYVLSYLVDAKSMQAVLITDYEKDSMQSDSLALLNLQKKIIQYPMRHQASVCVSVPQGYIIPKWLTNVVHRLETNKIQLETFEKDTIMKVTSYWIASNTTLLKPFSGHYRHKQTQIKSVQDSIVVQKGDYWVSTDQLGIAYLLETLEPEASDSFFSWNFFDEILSEDRQDYRSYFKQDTINKQPLYPIYRVEKK
ncbi:peptidase M14 [Capnocytophaga catalasegens]|uniref:Peptidase M14 carboxypeptidase A domain-containing protein n=1 Tax=Capnocytophaga catalasegens TaxID=1004260 RepID=A0AAV5AV67_9FLAO|nr:peptidase M14 [Capnocytophaga catalasegens]GIZ15576.1 hypothetical protein RCZ03_15760 [Capnocytophaga catalasegens]GJM50175.1 hypothetical protein RCZ15_11490 [Capnocytophaga catalasegens]GJM52062.1 hypothetical protein RCZ16_03800 [Capnocytophaga catalasegens]